VVLLLATELKIIPSFCDSSKSGIGNPSSEKSAEYDERISSARTAKAENGKRSINNPRWVEDFKTFVG
jgi:hypothetical protein